MILPSAWSGGPVTLAFPVFPAWLVCLHPWSGHCSLSWQPPLKTAAAVGVCQSHSQRSCRQHGQGAQWPWPFPCCRAWLAQCDGRGLTGHSPSPWCGQLMAQTGPVCPACNPARTSHCPLQTCIKAIQHEYLLKRSCMWASDKRQIEKNWSISYL